MKPIPIYFQAYDYDFKYVHTARIPINTYYIEFNSHLLNPDEYAKSGIKKIYSEISLHHSEDGSVFRCDCKTDTFDEGCTYDMIVAFYKRRLRCEYYNILNTYGLHTDETIRDVLSDCEIHSCDNSIQRDNVLYGRDFIKCDTRYISNVSQLRALSNKLMVDTYNEIQSKLSDNKLIEFARTNNSAFIKATLYGTEFKYVKVFWTDEPHAYVEAIFEGTKYVRFFQLGPEEEFCDNMVKHTLSIINEIKIRIMKENEVKASRPQNECECKDCKCEGSATVSTLPKNKVTPEDVENEIADTQVKTLDDFGKPTTYVAVILKNGFTMREATTCVDPNNYNESIGAKICLDRIKDKIWFLLGYKLQDDIYRASLVDDDDDDDSIEEKVDEGSTKDTIIPDFLQRMLNERYEVEDRIGKLVAFMEKNVRFKELPEQVQELMCEQLDGMKVYSNALEKRIDYFLATLHEDK